MHGERKRFAAVVCKAVPGMLLAMPGTALAAGTARCRGPGLPVQVPRGSSVPLRRDLPPWDLTSGGCSYDYSGPGFAGEAVESW
jgi:hypothetical protein